MKKISVFFICLAFVCSFVSCNNNVRFKESDNKTIIAKDGTEYSFIGFEGHFWCFGQREFIGHVKGEKRQFVHLTNTIQTGMYSVNGKQDVLIRYFPDNEFSAIYVKSDLLKTEVTLENCIRFEFVKDSSFYDDKTKLSNKGITECEQFLDEIKNGQTAKDAGLYDLVDGWIPVAGYVCGIIQEDINIVIPLEVLSFDDKAYSIKIDGVEYVLPEEWVTKLIAE